MLPVTLKIYLIAAYSAIAGILFGLDSGEFSKQCCSIGSVTRMVQFSDSIGHISPGQVGIYIACIMLSALVSSLLSGHVADIISRKYAILVGGLIVAIGSIISASVNSFPALICARLIAGIGHGQTVAAVTIYLCEIAPKNIRGTVATMQQLCLTIGVASGYFIAYGSSRLDNSLAWRIPFTVIACVAVILSIGMAFMPFSPRWLVQHGRLREARDVLSRLRQTTEDADEELESIRESLEDEGTQQASVSEVFSKRYIRRTLLGIFLMGFEMLCGMEAVIYYAPVLFTQAGFSSQRASFLASGISGIINMVFTIPAQLLVDKLGRRFLLIGGGVILAGSFLAIGSIYAAHSRNVNGEVHLDSKSQWAVIALLYVFVAAFSWSWAVVIRIYACEIMPTRLRAKACAFQHVANWLLNFVIAFTIPLFLQASPSGPYFLFGSLTCFTTLVNYIFMPETRGMSLEEIEELFEKDVQSSVWKA